VNYVLQLRMGLLGAVSDEVEWDWPGVLLTLDAPGTHEFVEIGEPILNTRTGRMMKRIGGRGKNLRFADVG
jgi:hypothetical protein